jgi:hypothetical protein
LSAGRLRGLDFGNIGMANCASLVTDMSDILATVLGKVFIHPATKEEYGPIRLPRQHAKRFSRSDGSSFEAIAEDSSGNYFTAMEDGAVWFWDHETDDLICLVSSVSEFVNHCENPSPVKLDLKQVKSAWIDPEFAKSIGKIVPKDGWVKKPSKGQ